MSLSVRFGSMPNTKQSLADRTVNER
jgi:hypothetical protein